MLAAVDRVERMICDLARPGEAWCLISTFYNWETDANIRSPAGVSPEVCLAPNNPRTGRVSVANGAWSLASTH